MQITVAKPETSELSTHPTALFPEFFEDPGTNVQANFLADFSSMEQLETGKAHMPDTLDMPECEEYYSRCPSELTEKLRSQYNSLIERHGSIFWQPRIVYANHPVAERRSINLDL